MLASLLHLTPAPEKLTFDIAGTKREAIFFRGQTRKAAPLVLVFHGFTGTAELAVRQFDLQARWPDASVIYAQGLPTKVIPGRPEAPGWQLTPRQSEGRDIKFVDALLAWANGDPQVDTKRIFYAGHSNGSAFAWVVLKERGEAFAGFAGLCGGTLLPLAGAPKRPAFVVAGSNDRLVPPKTVSAFASRLAAHNGNAATVKFVTYEGGHMPPASIYDQVVSFFKDLAP